MSAYPITDSAEIEGISLDPGKLSLTDGTFSTTVRPNDATTSYDLLLPPAAGTVGQVLTMSSATETEWATPTTSSRQIWVIQDSRTSGTNGGAFTASPTTRVLNTITTSPAASTDVQLAVAPASTNQILVQPGNYFVYIRAPFDIFNDPSTHIAVLWNNTTSSAELSGTSGFTTFNSGSSSFIIASITVGVQTVFSIRTYQDIVAATAINGGQATGAAGVDEVYTILYFEKLP